MKYRIIALSLLMPALAILAGCGAKGGAARSESGYSGGAADQRELSIEGTGLAGEIPAHERNAPEGGAAGTSAAAAAGADSAAGTAAAKTRKLVKKADISIEADKSFIDGEGRLTGVHQKVQEILAKYGAYAERTSSDEYFARFTIRTPQASCDAFMAETGALGKVRSRSESAEDVTLRYYDLEGRLNTRKALLVTFQGYLGRTQNIDDIMKVETRIAELQNEIDWLGTELTQLAGLVDYATVELTVYSAGHKSTYTLGDRIGNIFSSFGGFASGALVAVLWIVVFGVPVVLVCLFVFWLLFCRAGLLKKAFFLALDGKTTRAGQGDPKTTDNKE